MSEGREPSVPGDDAARAEPIFPRWTTRAFRAALVALPVLAVGALAMAMTWVRTPDLRRQYEPVPQPVPFSHPVHVTGQRIDCRYCHTTVERATTAGMPSTATCVPCHSDLWMRTDLMAPVRASLATGRPIPWRRVNGVPDFVFFDHAIHVRRGVGCETCHGRVDRMERVYQAAPLTMRWCLDCHRDPAPNLRRVSEVTTMGYHAPGPPAGEELRRRYHVRALTDCTTCHR